MFLAGARNLDLNLSLKEAFGLEEQNRLSFCRAIILQKKRIGNERPLLWRAVSAQKADHSMIRRQIIGETCFYNLIIITACLYMQNIT
jgi:hypothetical protein